MKKIDPAETLSPFEEELSRRLKAAPVPAVPLDEITAAARTAAAWLPPERSLWCGDFWRAALASLTAGAASFWALCAFLLGSGLALSLLWADLGTEPLAVLLPLSPVPFLCFLIRELQSRDAALIQLERVCVWDPARICFARLWAGVLLAAIAMGSLVLCISAFSRNALIPFFGAGLFYGATALWGNTIPFPAYLSSLLTLPGELSPFLLQTQVELMAAGHYTSIFGLVVPTLTLSVVLHLICTLGLWILCFFGYTRKQVKG